MSSPLIAPTCCDFLFPVYLQAPGATSVLRVTSGTLWCPGAAACPASATTTSTCTIPSHVMPRRVPVSGACTTPRAMRASTAKRVTTATLSLKAVGVSMFNRVFPSYEWVVFLVPNERNEAFVLLTLRVSLWCTLLLFPLSQSACVTPLARSPGPVRPPKNVNATSTAASVPANQM